MAIKSLADEGTFVVGRIIGMVLDGINIVTNVKDEVAVRDAKGEEKVP